MENEIINTEAMEEVSETLIEEGCAKTGTKIAVGAGIGTLAVVGGIIFYKKVAKSFIAALKEKRAQAKGEAENTEAEVEDKPEETEKD